MCTNALSKLFLNLFTSPHMHYEMLNLVMQASLIFMQVPEISALSYSTHQFYLTYRLRSLNSTNKKKKYLHNVGALRKVRGA